MRLARRAALRDPFLAPDVDGRHADSIRPCAVRHKPGNSTMVAMEWRKDSGRDDMGNANVTGAKRRSTSSVPQEARTELPGLDFEATALQQNVVPLPSHAEGVSTVQGLGTPPPAPASLTITPLHADATVIPLSPEQLRARSCGDTRRLLCPHPMTAPAGDLKITEVKKARVGFVASNKWSVCSIQNLDRESPLVDALGRYLVRRRKTKVSIYAIKGTEVKVKAKMSVEDLESSLQYFCKYVGEFRNKNMDDESIAFLLNHVPSINFEHRAGLYLTGALGRMQSPEFPNGAAGFHKLIAGHHYHLASLLIKEIQMFCSHYEQEARFSIDKVYDDLFQEITNRGVDLAAFGLPEFAYEHGLVRALFCIDLCTGPALDPVQAARIVVTHLVENGEPMPCQEAVMDCLCAMIETPEQAYRAMLAVVGSPNLESPLVESWMAPLLLRIVRFEHELFMDAWKGLNDLGTLEPVMLGNDHTTLDFMEFQPRDQGNPDPDEKTIEALEAVIATGARTEAGLSIAVAALEFLAKKSGWGQKQFNIEALKQILEKSVASSPHIGVRQRLDEVSARIHASDS